MDAHATSAAERKGLIPASYAVAALLLFIGITEFAAQLQGIFAPGEIAWRVGAFGLLSSLVTPVFAIFLAIVTAFLAGHRKTLRILSALATAGAVGLLAITCMFTLDFLQLRPSVQPDISRTFMISSVKAVINLSMMTAVLGFVGFSGWRSSAKIANRSQEAEKATETTGSLLVAGNAR